MSTASYGYDDTSRSEMRRLIPSYATRVLDMGCGQGAFGASLKASLPVEVWGIEASPIAAEVARGRLDHVLVLDLEGAPLSLPEGYFDCITCLDILEHLRDPWSFVRNLRRWLRPDGCVVASIPNVRHHSVLKSLLVDRAWDYQESGILDRSHLRFFTRDSVAGLFTGAGYDITTLVGINGSNSWQFRLANLLTLSVFEDTRFRQWACVARLPQ